MPKLLHAIDFVTRVVITICLTITPLMFLPFFSDQYDIAKWLILVAGALLVLILTALRIAVSRTIVLPKNGYADGFFALTIAAILSVIFISTNRVEGMVNSYGIATFFALAVLVACAAMYRDRDIKEWVRWGFVASSSLIGIVAVYQFLGMGKLLAKQLPYLSDSLWTPAGSAIASATLMLVALPLALGIVLHSRKEKKETSMIVGAIASLLLAVGFGVTAWGLFPKLATLVLPMQSAWVIMMEIYKSPKMGLFGVGAENFANAFSVGKGTLYNLSPVWNIRFSVSASSFLHIATTIGVLGIVAFFMLIRHLVLPLSWAKNREWTISAGLAALALFIAPPHMVMLILVAVLLVLKHHEGDHVHTIKIPDAYPWVGYATGGVILIVCGIGGYIAGRYILGDIYYTQSLRAAAANQAQNTYELGAKAIVTDPYISTYHTAFAQVNIALAAGIANAARQKAPQDNKPVTLSQTEQQTVAQLIQQGIEQAKIGITLAPDNSLWWEVLGRIYQNISGIVENADTWSSAAYEKAVLLDPSTPTTRLSLAGAYMVKNDFPSARDQLVLAAQLKNDIANIHYNLAYVYRTLKQYDMEQAALKRTLELVAPDSADAAKVKKELDAVSENLTKPAQEASQQTIQAPKVPVQQPLTTPVLTPPAQVTPKIEITP